jgi:hypothetical protein
VLIFPPMSVLFSIPAHPAEGEETGQLNMPTTQFSEVIVLAVSLQLNGGSCRLDFRGHH